MPVNGFSFQPGAVDPTRQPLQQNPAQSPQSIVKMLSLRMPKRAESGQIAPQALLQGQGGDGLQGVLQALMRAFAPHAQVEPERYRADGNQTQSFNVPGLQAPSFPTPRITPGDTGTTPGRELQPLPDPVPQQSPMAPQGREPRFGQPNYEQLFNGTGIQGLF